MTVHLHPHARERLAERGATEGEVLATVEGDRLMKLTYDPRRNIAYLRLQEKGGEVETIRISEQLNIDVAPDGTVYGVELLNANEQLQASDDGALIVVNEAIGERREIRLIS